jgi:RimJ/RimL family protein N-acetyltransferase
VGRLNLPRHGAVVPELRTGRLLLRRWHESDREPFAALNADPVVMEHFPSVLTARESDTFVDRIEEHFDRHGWGLWAVEVVHTASFAGYVGLWPATFEAHFTPAVEVGWRLGRGFWNHGYATEAAHVALDYGFGPLAFDEIVSFTAIPNSRSQRVMRKLGMSHDPADDFDHPNLPPGHHLQRHVLYRMSKPETP